MMNNSHEKDINEQIKSVLDSSVDSLDEKTRHELQNRRASVLNDERGLLSQSKWPVFGGVTAIASIGLLSVFLFISQPQIQPLDTNMMTSMDAMLFEADTNIELYEQYDFYVWLSQQESNG